MPSQLLTRRFFQHKEFLSSVHHPLVCLDPVTSGTACHPDVAVSGAHSSPSSVPAAAAGLVAILQEGQLLQDGLQDEPTDLALRPRGLAREACLQQGLRHPSLLTLHRSGRQHHRESATGRMCGSALSLQ